MLWETRQEGFTLYMLDKNGESHLVEVDTTRFVGTFPVLVHVATDTRRVGVVFVDLDGTEKKSKEMLLIADAAEKLAKALLS